MTPTESRCIFRPHQYSAHRLNTCACERMFALVISSCEEGFFFFDFSFSDAALAVRQLLQRWHSGTLPMLFTAAVIREKSFVRLDTYPTCLSRKALIQRGESADVLEVGRLGEGDVPHFLINADTNRKLILLCVRWGVGRWEGAAATSDECKIYIHSQARLQPKAAPITVFTQSFICRAKSGHAVLRKKHTRTHTTHTHTHTPLADSFLSCSELSEWLFRCLRAPHTTDSAEFQAVLCRVLTSGHESTRTVALQVFGPYKPLFRMSIINCRIMVYYKCNWIHLLCCNNYLISYWQCSGKKEQFTCTYCNGHNISQTSDF